MPRGGGRPPRFDGPRRRPKMGKAEEGLIRASAPFTGSSAPAPRSRRTVDAEAVSDEGLVSVRTQCEARSGSEPRLDSRVALPRGWAMPPGLRSWSIRVWIGDARSTTHPLAFAGFPMEEPLEASQRAFARVLALTDPTDRLRRPPGLARSRAEPNRCDRPAEAGRRADRSSVAA